MLYLASSNSERQCSEGAMGRGVAVSAHDGHARLRKALLGPDDMNNPLAFVARAIAGNAEILAVSHKLHDLGFSYFIQNRERSIVSGNAMIRGPDGEIRPPHLQAPTPES